MLALDSVMKGGNMWVSEQWEKMGIFFHGDKKEDVISCVKALSCGKDPFHALFEDNLDN